MLKRSFGILLVVLMVLSIVPAVGEGQDWTTPYDEPVEIHIALEESATAIFAEGEDHSHNLWTKFFKEHYNVDVIVD